MRGQPESPPSQASALSALSADEEEFWRAFLRAIVMVPRALDADLMAGHEFSTSEYTSLVHLSEAPDRRMRMSDLADSCALSLSGTSRIVSRLEERGLLRREPCRSDGRGWDAVLTSAGLARLRGAWPVHVASVRRNVLDHLRGLDLRAVTVAVSRFGTSGPEEAGRRSGANRPVP